MKNHSLQLPIPDNGIYWAAIKEEKFLLHEKDLIIGSHCPMGFGLLIEEKDFPNYLNRPYVFLKIQAKEIVPLKNSKLIHPKKSVLLEVRINNS